MHAEVHTALLQLLEAELDQATRDHLGIQNEMEKLVLDAPSGRSLTDEQQSVINACREAEHAFSVYERSLKTLRDYVDASRTASITITAL